jgi:uncharacterized membrane protein YgcG
MEFFNVGSPCSLNNAPVEGFTNKNESCNDDSELRKDYLEVVDRLRENNSSLNVQQIELGKLKKITNPCDLREILWSLLTSVYRYNSQVLDSNLDEMEKAEELISEQKKLSQKDRTIVDEIKGLNLTNKRKIKIENYAFEKTLYHVNFLKTALIVLAILIVVPLLRFLSIITRELAWVLYLVVLVGLVLYGIYQLYYKSLNRDENDFNQFNFGKPNDKQVLMSKLNGRLSEKDRQRCMDIEELDGGDLDPASLVIPEHKLNEWKQDSCSVSGSEQSNGSSNSSGSQSNGSSNSSGSGSGSSTANKSSTNNLSNAIASNANRQFQDATRNPLNPGALLNKFSNVIESVGSKDVETTQAN